MKIIKLIKKIIITAKNGLNMFNIFYKLIILLNIISFNFPDKKNQKTKSNTLWTCKP